MNFKKWNLKKRNSKETPVGESCGRILCGNPNRRSESPSLSFALEGIHQGTEYGIVPQAAQGTISVTSR